ncbi:zinc dependent phospholipase C family protein [Chitinophaga sedimenti]|uniref:zinc dependent phospholipase C family protein n=1 Tax=Chitinophaga sedimenti TaxID=2033606 RepID=UPI0020048333|nr:zinc dependent phospholipase C family protein [Chitinophaga sedimenti]MCK7557949.1 zinc dependent phospholipase C family protein [Chitinophaga sedimenti]
MLTRIICIIAFLAVPLLAIAWGFFGHEKINRHAIYSLPPSMVAFYKLHTDYPVKHSTDPDKRRYLLPDEGPRHYIDLDHYPPQMRDSLAIPWKQAVAKFGLDSLQPHGVLPRHFETMMYRLTAAFICRDVAAILKVSAELGHYVADAHVPLHSTANHNGQLTGQHGIHGLWESRIPELLADAEFDVWAGKAAYIREPRAFIWRVIGESAAAADSVLMIEKRLSQSWPADARYAWENRKGKLTRSYASDYTKAYNHKMGDMVERRMRSAMLAVACCWYTAWANAGQPPLQMINNTKLPDVVEKEQEQLEQGFQAGKIFGREH